VTGVTALAVTSNYGRVLEEWRRTVPTDLPNLSARERDVQTQMQTNTTIALLWFIIVLANLVLLFADQSYAKALELMGQF
jgi:hypothetical protein